MFRRARIVVPDAEGSAALVVHPSADVAGVSDHSAVLGVAGLLVGDRPERPISAVMGGTHRNAMQIMPMQSRTGEPHLSST